MKTMKAVVIFTLALCCSVVLSAQIYRDTLAIVQKANTQHFQAVQVQKRTYPVQLAGPDLIVHEIRHVQTGNGRYLKVAIKNVGNKTAGACYLALKYKWKFDYENFTQQELKYGHSVSPIAAGKTKVLTLKIPDQKIKSTQLGSKNVGISSFIDVHKKIAELKEDNNKKGYSLKILK